MNGLSNQAFAAKMRQQNRQLSIHAPVLMWKKSITAIGNRLDERRADIGALHQSELHGAQVVQHLLRVLTDRHLVETMEYLFGPRAGLIGFAEGNDALQGDAIVLLLPESRCPLVWIDALDQESGGHLHETVAITQERPDRIDWRLDVGADQRFAGAPPNQRVFVT